MILWLAALKGVPNELYEAAAVDGAKPRHQFFAITMPQLSPVFLFSLVIGVIGSLQEFDRVYVLNPSERSAGPGDSMLTPVYHLFQNGFGYFRMGYASALAWLLFAVILLLTLIQLKLAPRWVHYEAEPE
jgi:multiple sugar transport system permease protein